jgi:ribosomal protein S18 acetylase RimI-like enzyme
MMGTNLTLFTQDMLPEAGKLLAKRHQRDRQIFPFLPERFENSQMAEKAVSALWHKKFKSGYAAFRNGKMTGYLLGEYSIQPWGRCGYVYLPGYALEKDESLTTLQDLYALLGDDWVQKGIFSHGLYVSKADSMAVEALFDIGFGKERVDALLDLGTLEFPELEKPAGITVRSAGKGDNEHLGGISDVIARALAKPPYWHPTVPEDWNELRKGWSELADDDEWTVWMALENDELLGVIGFTTQTETDTDILARPHSVYMSIAATKPQARGRGLSTYLTWHGLAQAHQSGYETCYTNWISPNLLASRHWPRYGFKEVSYRLSKRVNPMISWTSK